MSSTRIYIVKGPEGERLVEAASTSQAIRHVVTPKYTAGVASTKQLAQLMTAGAKVETATSDTVASTQGEK